MKHITSALLIATCTLLTLAVTAHADDKADIVSLYAKLQHAMKAQSPEETLALLAPDFSHKTMDGKVQNGKQFTDLIGIQKSEVTVKEFQLKVTKTTVTGKTAKVTNEYSWAMDIVDKAGQMREKGKHHVMASTGTVENDLVKTPNGWRFLTLNTVAGNITIDGKPVKHRAAAPPPTRRSD